MLNRRSPRFLLVLGALLAVAPLLVAERSHAEEKATRRWRPPTPSWSSVTVSLEDEGGQALRTFARDGKTFVLGEFGQRYNIRVRNPLSFRVEVVASVDGRDVVSGRQADFVQNRGYLLGPGDSVVIEGFRTSLEEVAAFRFTDPSDSYSSRRGTPQNVGIVGVAFFGERVQRPLLRDDAPIARARKSGRTPQGAGAGTASRSDGEGPAPERKAQNLGTAFGEARTSHVREVSFERENPRNPARVITLRYDDARGLQARGIDVFGDLGRAQVSEPDAFPLSRFAPPPPGR